jgi:predicted P-loop ATPase
MKLDFPGLASYLRSRSRELIPQWLPGGKMSGKEYEVGSLNGEKGKSLKVNVDTGMWADFSTQDKGGDLISLYAAVERIDQKEAFNRLAERFHFTNGHNGNNGGQQTEGPRLVVPPRDAPPPPSLSLGGVKPTTVWEYKNQSSKLLFYVARYDKEDGKEFRPWSWSSENLWVAKAWPENRPIYGLELLKPDKPILIVEGEKACDAARKLTSIYTVVSWMSGSKAVTKTDWRPLYGRKILLWPDADRKKVKERDSVWLDKGLQVGDLIPYEGQPGYQAMQQIAEMLYPHCPEIKIINVSGVEEDGWDAADALAQGWNFAKFRDWAKPLVKTLKPVPVEITPLDRVIKSEAVVIQEPDQNIPSVQLIPDDVPRNITFQALWDQAGVLTTRQGAPVVNVDSCLKLLRHVPAFKDLIWWDEFHAKIFTRWDGGEPREWRETDETNLASYFQSELGLTKVNDELIRKSVFAFAERNIRNEPRDWMNTLTWDNVPRIESFFAECMGAADTEFTRAASKNFWISMAARIFKPGCKVDTMIILEGGQGKFKSSALEIIGGKWFAETNEAPTNKDFFLAMQGKMLLEVGELDAFSKADFKTIKKVLSCKTDNFRPPFGRYTKAFPRQSIFCGSTNEDEYLDDPTGGRRFWPFRVHSVVLDKIKQDREQLFAEAVARFKAGESWWVVPLEAKEEQEKRRQSDAWESIISDWLTGQSVLATDIRSLAQGALKIEAADLTRPVQQRITKILKMIGWRNKTIREHGHIRKAWAKEPVFDDE